MRTFTIVLYYTEYYTTNLTPQKCGQWVQVWVHLILYLRSLGNEYKYEYTLSYTSEVWAMSTVQVWVKIHEPRMSTGTIRLFVQTHSLDTNMLDRNIYPAVYMFTKLLASTMVLAYIRATGWLENYQCPYAITNWLMISASLMQALIFGLFTG